MSKGIHFYAEKVKFSLLPEFIILNIARKKSIQVLNYFYKLNKSKNFNYKITTDYNKEDIKKQLVNILETQKKVISLLESISLLTNIVIERQLYKINKTINNIKSKNLYSDLVPKLEKCRFILTNTFEHSFRLIQAYEKGSRTYIVGSTEQLLSEIKHRLWALKLYEIRPVKHEHNKLKSHINHVPKNEEKYVNHAKKILNTVKKLESKLYKLKNTYEGIHHITLESSLKLEKKFEKENQNIFSELEDTLFLKEDLKLLRKKNKERNIQYSNFITTERSHLNTIVKDYKNIK